MTNTTIMMADPNLTSLKDVQRELDAIKAERRRRQRALYVIHPPAPSSTAKAQQGRFATSVRTVICGNLLGRRGESNGHQPSYRPEVSLPLQLLTMAYVARPDGLLSPCPSHYMGNKVEALDLSPWNVSSTEQIDVLWRENRQAFNTAVCTEASKVPRASTLLCCHIGGELSLMCHMSPYCCRLAESHKPPHCCGLQ